MCEEWKGVSQCRNTVEVTYPNTLELEAVQITDISERIPFECKFHLMHSKANTMNIIIQISG